KGTNSNDYVEINVDYTTTDDKFRLVSFTLRDKAGFEFIFLPTEADSKVDYYNGNSLFLMKKTFSLDQIKDKRGTVLAKYIYNDSLPVTPQPHQKYNIALEKIIAPAQGEIDFAFNKIEIKDPYGEVVKNIAFTFGGGGLDKYLLENVKVYGSSLDSYEEYKLTYKYYPNMSSAKMFYGFPHTACSRANFDENHIHFDYGALSKIIYPGGGTVFYEYEP